VHKARTITPVQVDSSLWATSLLPEGMVERWLRPDYDYVLKGQALAVVRLEDALHEIIAPAEGWLSIDRKTNSVIEPGMVIGRIEEN
jgi:pyruvate/2-oxoglutarate dehydrogenase complex dihydrolipoamide acyltransferase (E2) component